MLSVIFSIQKSSIVCDWCALVNYQAHAAELLGTPCCPGCLCGVGPCNLLLGIERRVWFLIPKSPSDQLQVVGLLRFILSQISHTITVKLNVFSAIPPPAHVQKHGVINPLNGLHNSALGLSGSVCLSPPAFFGRSGQRTPKAADGLSVSRSWSLAGFRRHFLQAVYKPPFVRFCLVLRPPLLAPSSHRWKPGSYLSTAAPVLERIHVVETSIERQNTTRLSSPRDSLFLCLEIRNKN